jgi:hypothetical protein
MTLPNGMIPNHCVFKYSGARQGVCFVFLMYFLLLPSGGDNRDCVFLHLVLATENEYKGVSRVSGMVSCLPAIISIIKLYLSTLIHSLYTSLILLKM